MQHVLCRTAVRVRVDGQEPTARWTWMSARRIHAQMAALVLMVCSLMGAYVEQVGLDSTVRLM